METQNKQALWDKLEQHELPAIRGLYELSGLIDDDLQKFKSVWTEMPSELKLKLITSLTEIAEADFATDFTDIFTIALDSSEPEISILAIEGLAESEDIRLIPKLKHILKMSIINTVRAKAAESLASFVLLGELGKIRESIFIDTVSTLIEIVTNTSEYINVRRRALEAVAYTSLRDVPELIQTAYDSNDEKMTISAVFAMGRSADKRWASIVRKELDSLNPEMRFEATRACGDLHLSEAVTDLIALTDDVDIEVQEMALWSLGQIGGQRARRKLDDMVESENEALAIAAQQAIDELDFFQTDISTFLGPPSEFSGEGEESWFTREGYLHGQAEDEFTDIDDDDLNDFQSEDNLWEQGN